jgi:Domain of unknown function (DUF5047)
VGRAVLTVPEWAEAAIADTHRAEWTVDLLPLTGPPIRLPVTAGNVRSDAGTYPRHTATVSVGDMSLAPVIASDPLVPFGSRLDLRYTLTDPTGRTFTIRPVPPLIVDTVEVERGGAVGIEVTASDASLAVDTDALIAPTDPPPGATDVSQAIAWLIRRTWPDAVIVDEVASDQWVGKGWQADGSPWAAIEGLGDRVGAEVYVDAAERWRVRRVPSIGDPVATLATGPGGTVTALRSRIVRGYNRVALVFRTDTGATVQGVWADRSGGPLDVSGPYGRVTLVESRDGAVTEAEADAAAARYARRAAGRVRDVEIEAPALPWIECGDTVRVRFPTRPDELVMLAADHDLTGARPSRYTFRTDTQGPT